MQAVGRNARHFQSLDCSFGHARCRMSACGNGAQILSQMMIDQRLGHLAAAGIAGAEDKDGWFHTATGALIAG
ncbi:MAG: hypothetical protein A2Z94_06435 [Gallionellales bacterium GWA2_55_18]|nr:MAG: hypothetical protein A2Z94_06435 [Gallionellales bacterium GWA2_55_18]